MGNNIGGANTKAAKIMKINGDCFKLKTPSNVIDLIKDYPDHILLDSEEFLRYNLRAKPLDLDFELKPKKIYLLFELPKFPQNDQDVQNSNSNSNNNNNNNSVFNLVKTPLRRVNSGVLESSIRRAHNKESRMSRSISDLPIMTKSTAIRSGTHVLCPTRVKVRLPKGQVEKIMEESNDDDVEIARRILRLFSTVDNGSVVAEGGGRGEERRMSEEEEVEVEVVDKRFFNVHSLCGSHQGDKYKKLGK